VQGTGFRVSRAGSRDCGLRLKVAVLRSRVDGLGRGFRAWSVACGLKAHSYNSPWILCI
jgi:hypothetical protein